MRAAFYCVADGRYFLGAVAMINSLRHHGHGEPIYLLDCGLSAEQRELLAPEVTLVANRVPTLPWLLKTVAPLAHPAEVMVLIDADMIVARSLAEPIELAADGRVVAFRTDYQRWFDQWGEMFELGELRRGTYVGSGLVFAERELGSAILACMDERRPALEALLTARTPGAGEDPLFALDQDLFNAVLAGVADEDRVLALAYRLAPNQPFADLRASSDSPPRLVYADGSSPYVVHHLARKPWLEPLATTIYSRLLAAYLFGPRLAIRVPRETVPAWLRPGPVGGLVRAPIEARERAGWFLRRRLPKPLLQRVDRARIRRRWLQSR